MHRLCGARRDLCVSLSPLIVVVVVSLRGAESAPGRCAPDCRLSRGRAECRCAPASLSPSPPLDAPGAPCCSSIPAAAIAAATTAADEIALHIVDPSAAPRRSTMANKVAKGRKARCRPLPSRFRPSLSPPPPPLSSSLFSFVFCAHLNLCVCIYLSLGFLFFSISFSSSSFNSKDRNSPFFLSLFSPLLLFFLLLFAAYLSLSTSSYDYLCSS